MIFIKDNFVEKSLCEKLIATSRDKGASRVISEGESKVLDVENRKSKKLELPDDLSEELRSQLIQLLPEIKTKIEIESKLEIEKIKGLKYEPGHFFKRHIDVGESGTAARRVLTAIIFLNNQSKEEPKGKSFSGGELTLYGVFPKIPKLGFPVKAVAGRLVVFPSKLPHEVTEIEEGVRYTLVAWYLSEL